MTKFHMLFHYLPGMTETDTSQCPVLAVFELATSLICTGVSPSQPECLVHTME